MERPPEWMGHGLCQQVDPDLWFPDTDPWQVQKAKAVCLDCPVMAECADYAITRYVPHGIWGGMTAEDRVKYRRRNGIKKPRVTLTCDYCSEPFTPINVQMKYCTALCKKRKYEATKRPNPKNQ